MKKLFKRCVFILLILSLMCFPFLYAQDDDDVIHEDEMDPDLNETPIEYRTIGEDDEDLEQSVYIQSGLTLEELANIISDKLENWEEKYNIDISEESKSRIIKDTINDLINKEDFSEDSIEDSLEKSIIKEVINIVLDKVEDYDIELSDKSKEDIAVNVLNKILEGDSDGLDIDIKDSLEDELSNIITQAIVDKLEEMNKDIDGEDLNDIIVIVIGRLNLKEEKITEETIKKAVEEALRIYFDSSIIPDSGEKTHIVVKGDNLYDLSYEYYDRDDRKRGAHWVHIYDYSVKKGYIDPDEQPIVPKYEYKYYVKLNIGQKVSIPYMEGEYPSVEELLNKYGYTINDEGDVEDIETNIPINIDIED